MSVFRRLTGDQAYLSPQHEKQQSEWKKYSPNQCLAKANTAASTSSTSTSSPYAPAPAQPRPQRRRWLAAANNLNTRNCRDKQSTPKSTRIRVSGYRMILWTVLFSTLNKSWAYTSRVYADDLLTVLHNWSDCRSFVQTNQSEKWFAKLKNSTRFL